MSSLLSKSLFFSPKKLLDPWEHKHGFLVSIDCRTALNFISNGENVREKKSFYGPLPNSYLKMDYDFLRRCAEDTLYEIESSQANYVEITSILCGLCSGFYLLGLIPAVWSYHDGDQVKLMLILFIAFITSIVLYVLKQRIDTKNLEYFLDIEDALYYYDNGYRLFHRKYSDFKK